MTSSWNCVKWLCKICSWISLLHGNFSPKYPLKTLNGVSFKFCPVLAFFTWAVWCMNQSRDTASVAGNQMMCKYFRADSRFASSQWETALLCTTSLIGWAQKLILGLRPANGRRRYFVSTSLIGRAQTFKHPILGLCAANGRRRNFVTTFLIGCAQT